MIKYSISSEINEACFPVVCVLHYLCSTVISALSHSIFAKAKVSTGVFSPGLRCVLTAPLPNTNQTLRGLSFASFLMGRAMGFLEIT